MQIQGGRILPGTKIEFTADLGNEPQQRAMTKGLKCITWSHADVMANLDDFRMLMGSDNKGSDTGMDDSELHIIGNTLSDMQAVRLKVGGPLEDVLMICLHAHASALWSEVDRTVFIDSAQQTSQLAFDFIMAFTDLVTYFARFNVPSWLFRVIIDVTKLREQWFRVIWVCRVYAAG